MQYAQNVENVGKSLGNGTANGNQHLFYEHDAWEAVMSSIDALLSTEISEEHRASLQKQRAEIQKKLDLVKYKIQVRQLVRKESSPLDPSKLPSPPTEMPANVPGSPEAIVAKVKELLRIIILPPLGKSEAERERAVNQARDTFIRLFLVNWQNTKGRFAAEANAAAGKPGGTYRIPFTQQKEWLKYFREMISGQIAFLERVSDYRMDALLILHTKVIRAEVDRLSNNTRKKFSSLGGRRKNSKKNRKTRKHLKRS